MSIPPKYNLKNDKSKDHSDTECHLQLLISDKEEFSSSKYVNVPRRYKQGSKNTDSDNDIDCMDYKW